MAGMLFACCKQLVLPPECQCECEEALSVSNMDVDDGDQATVQLPRYAPEAKRPDDDVNLLHLSLDPAKDPLMDTRSTTASEGSHALRMVSISNWSELDSAWSPGTTSLSARSSEPDANLVTVTIRKAAGESLGLSLDTLDSHALLISAVLDGPVRRYNKATADVQLRVQPGDSLLAVDGAAGSSEALVSRLKAFTSEQTCAAEEESLELILQRPRSFTVNIQRAYRPLGLQLEHSGAAASGLLVQAVTPGLLRDWNVANRSSAVKRLDRILRVNGAAGSPETLLGKMKVAAATGQRLELEVHRYAPWEHVARRISASSHELEEGDEDTAAK
eukprot:gb/GFBE01020182.1/.p1 GENE.gb/GFBE01020182.1/~~gb/GFBE01020182.1/.p1  ORF type:complete len:332 (+),score=86.86 gb/GFBE01020182.1/:1-996(+)